jgi:hypothetical protein
MTASFTIRMAYPDDRAAVHRLATLDARPVPPGPVLVAEVDGELWAAVPLDGGEAIADPFHPSGPLVALLRARVAQLTAPAPSRRRRLSLRRRRAGERGGVAFGSA